MWGYKGNVSAFLVVSVKLRLGYLSNGVKFLIGLRKEVMKKIFNIFIELRLYIQLRVLGYVSLGIPPKFKKFLFAGRVRTKQNRGFSRRQLVPRLLIIINNNYSNKTYLHSFVGVQETIKLNSQIKC